MPDSRFYRRAGPLPVSRVAEIAGTALPAGSDASRRVSDVAAPDAATSDDVIFISDKALSDSLRVTKAGVCLVTPDLIAEVPAGAVALVCKDPRAVFAQVAALLYPETAPRWEAEGVSPAATIAKGAILAANVVVAAGAHIGARVKIGPHCVIGPGVVIGDDSVIGANVTITHALIGARVIVHPGTQIGQDGFGYYATAQGPQKVPQLGRVIVHDDVEIGANCAIDRGALADTVIGRGTKLDNLVQIGHNVVIGQACIIVAQVGISGSCTIGDGVVIAGQAGLKDHLKIGSGAQIAAQSGLMRDVAPGEKVMGTPAKPIRAFFKEVAALAKLAKRG